MDRIKRYSHHGHTLCVCHRKKHEAIVREGLAYTPAKMAELTSRGLPVNNINASTAFYEGSQDATFHVGSERLRGIDVADLWEQHQQLRNKARQAVKAKRHG